MKTIGRAFTARPIFAAFSRSLHFTHPERTMEGDHPHTRKAPKMQLKLIAAIAVLLTISLAGCNAVSELSYKGTWQPTEVTGANAASLEGIDLDLRSNNVFRLEYPNGDVVVGEWEITGNNLRLNHDETAHFRSYVTENNIIIVTDNATATLLEVDD